MTQQTLDIERVVRQVLAELGLAPNADAAPPTQANQTTIDTRELVLSGRVITLSAVEGRLADICRLTVPAGAVVTPAVRDELRRLEILLTFVSAADATADAGHRIKLLTTIVGTRTTPENVSEMLRGENVEVAAERSNCLIRTTDAFAQELTQPNTLGLLITRHTAAGLCLANRKSGVRAILGSNAAKIAGDVAAIGANLLVVDPAAVGPYQLKQIVTQFCRGGPAVCPAVFEGQLA